MNWMYDDRGPKSPLTTKDRMILATIGISSIAALGAIGYILWELVH